MLSLSLEIKLQALSDIDLAIESTFSLFVFWAFKEKLKANITIKNQTIFSVFQKMWDNSRNEPDSKPKCGISHKSNFWQF